MGLGDWLRDSAEFVGDGISTAWDAGQELDNLILGEKNAEAFRDRSVQADVRGAAKHGLEKSMAGMLWLYDNGISQPISTFLLQGTSVETGQANLFSASDWAKAWHVAEHVSPGQAFWANSPEVQQILKDEPLYATPPAAYLPPDWAGYSFEEQQEMLGQAGMPRVGNRAVEKIRKENGWFTFASGSTDLAFRWYLDPLIIGGKVAGAYRTAKVVKPRPAEGWSAGEIDRLMTSSTMAKAQRFLWENREDAALLNNLDMARKSAMGPRFGGIVASLKSEEEVALFLRVGLGDARARALLEERNLVAANRLQKDTARLSELDLSALPRVIAQRNPRAEVMVKQRRLALENQINADTELVERYNGALSHYAELDQINLTRFSFTRAHNRTAAQAAYKAGPARIGRKADAAFGFHRVYSDYMGTPLTVIRAFKEAHPNGWMRIDDIHKESVDELRAQLARVPNLGSAERAEYLNRYLKTTTEGQRLDMLDEIGEVGIRNVGAKYGLSAEESRKLYDAYKAEITGGQEALHRYSAAYLEGGKIHVDEFSVNGKLAVHPNLATRLANDQVLIDLKALDKVLSRHSSAFTALRAKAGGSSDWIIDGVDWFNHLWKFATLFRLGYIPRVLGDDLAGQVARLGAVAMAARAGYGVKNLATNLAHRKEAAHLSAREATLREGIKYTDDEIAGLMPQANTLRTRVETRGAINQAAATQARDRLRRAKNKLAAMGPDAAPAKVAAMKQLVARHEAAAARAEGVATKVTGRQTKLTEMDERLSFLQAERAAALKEADEAKALVARGFRQKSQLHSEPVLAGGIKLPPALAGEQGEYFQKMISSDDSLRNVLARNKQMIHGNISRSYSNMGVSVSLPQAGEQRFVAAWHQAINNQLMQDQLAVQAIRGASVDDMTRWLTHTVEGRGYRKRLGLQYTSNDRVAASVWHDVAEYMPTWEIRAAALEGKADTAFLADAVKKGMHPREVHATQLGENLAGSNAMSKGMDKVIDWWYKWAAAMPADRMSRHPLFNQLYEGHAAILARQELKQGVKLGQKDADRLAETARRLALRDTRRLVFDIAHRTDVGAALRFTSPFYAATTEAWQRWARIIADRPQVVGYGAQFFNAPLSMGVMQDMDGNRVARDGTVTVIDPETGKASKKIVPKGQRYITFRTPKFIANGPVGKALGLDASGNWKVSQDSVNMITQGDPFFNPGVGPVVQVPVNEWVKDKPKLAEIARHAGILPFGATTGQTFGNNIVGRGLQQTLPTWSKNLLTAFDTSDERYQRVKLHIMQRAAYEHAALGKPMPSAKEIANRTRDYWIFSSVTAGLQPAATQRGDNYQFFRDQYMNLRRQDPLAADEKFLERFGESYFIFAQEMSNSSGVPPTKKAVELQQKYAGQIAANPELAALIVGPDGNGPYSPEAYVYQLNVPLVPGGAEMQRTKISADEAMAENSKRLGWAKFTAKMNELTAQLHSQGFSSFSDAGAEELADTKQAYIKLYSTPMFPDGSPNPHYNEEWAKDFNTYDPQKYDRLIPALTEVARSELAKLPGRSDLRVLQEYLGARQALLQELAARGEGGGAKTLRAKANSDLARRWAVYVDSLIERDTKFGDLHHRYLSRDLGVDAEEMAEQQEEEVPAWS